MNKRATLLCSSMMLAGFVLAACGPPPPPSAGPPAPAPTPEPAKPAMAFDAISRADFNMRAPELALPLFWVTDDGNGTIEPGELAVLFGIDGSRTSDWVDAGGFTPRFEEAYAALKSNIDGKGPALKLDAAETQRRALVLRELRGGQPTVVANDFTNASAEDKAIVDHILAAAAIIEDLHLKQVGSATMADRVPKDDPASRMLFYRNEGPWCATPAVENDKACSAIPGAPKKVSGLYPAKLQADPGFCDALKKEKDAEKLRHQFHVVVEENGALVAKPYHQHWASEMKQISDRLTKAAGAITSASEAPFKKYLLAAAKAFTDNNWEPADEAWAAMNAENSKWYLRIAPDEVYFEPCSLKAGFHVSFARINQDSLKWQRRLDPVKGDMEKALAKLAGAPYKAREVSFHLPDFIDIVLNAGDSRSSHGATIGQSLPNWGPVANEGRGRTVAMTNLYTDTDSQKALEGQASSLLCKATMAKFTSDPTPQIMGTVLHEAAHNLGPAHEYKVRGKAAREIFGGPMASTLEELKAQTAALYFTDWLVEKKVLSQDEAEKAHVRDITWTFGHISRGMYTSTGKPKPYSQLAAVQVGFLVEKGAAEWKADETAHNGKDQGCIELHLDKFPPVVTELMTQVARIKARGDDRGAKALKKKYVDVTGDGKKLLDTIAERWLRAPKATFVYSIKR
jgi:hypothetical protein